MLRKFIRNLIPPDNWILPVILALGVLTGLGIFSFHISNASSYLGDKPETCVNCHIMAPQYATWNHSSHREKAHCNDCHVPHNNVFNKYYFILLMIVSFITLIFSYPASYTYWDGIEINESMLYENCGVDFQGYMENIDSNPDFCPEGYDAIQQVGGRDIDIFFIFMAVLSSAIVFTALYFIAYLFFKKLK